jgi:peptidoglycan/xylan/chitin deacetylase (PgdA/CDA1 family)
LKIFACFLKEIALVFTGDTFADGGTHIRQVLAQQQIKASFFFTGNFYRNSGFKTLSVGLLTDGHYLGAHSDAHLLYCAWENRDSLLVNQEQFTGDWAANYRGMEKLLQTLRDKGYRFKRVDELLERRE